MLAGSPVETVGWLLGEVGASSRSTVGACATERVIAWAVASVVLTAAYERGCDEESHSSCGESRSGCGWSTEDWMLAGSPVETVGWLLGEVGASSGTTVGVYIVCGW